METVCGTTSEDREKLSGLSIRIPPDDIDWLKQDAAANSRSISGSIRHYIRLAREQAAA